MDKIVMAKELVKIAKDVVALDNAPNIEEWCKKTKSDYLKTFKNKMEITYSSKDNKCKFWFEYDEGADNARELAAEKKRFEGIVQFIENAVNEFKKLFPNVTLVW